MEALLSLTILALPIMARAIAEAAQRAARRHAWRDPPVGDAADALRGHKVAQLIVGADERMWLAGVTSLRYGIDEVARCRRRRCEPPGLDCRCGFYAYRRRADAVELLAQLTVRHPARSYVLLSVDLDGEVLEYELGYRAERQRVLRIEVPATCIRCLRDGRHADAVGMVAHPRFRGEQLLYERALTARLALPVGSTALRPLCAAHLPEDARVFDLAQLRDRTATEVERLATPELPPGSALAS